MVRPLPSHSHSPFRSGIWRKGKSENRESREGVWYPGSVKDVNREQGQLVEGSAWGRAGSEGESWGP